ncbi:glycosyltransferase [Arthrobacter sp. SAFR-044]|uniref:glycosyltransferase n=1 Tax=Arthrobacter sp. SAFR-044 TaxID=3387278 RepID=UPI003F7C6A39
MKKDKLTGYGTELRRVAYLNVHDLNYPRNRLIRRKLQQVGSYEIAVTQKIESPHFVAKTILNSVAMLRTAWRSDVVVLSEFSLRYAPFTWFLSRINGAVHVVDGFVRLYETRVEDLSQVKPRSWKALAYRVVDALSVFFSDVYLVDTKVRAAGIMTSTKARTNVVSLPVGAPGWARCAYPAVNSEDVRLLYYGNYIHLHGVDTIVRAVAQLDPDRKVTLTLLGDGKLRPEIETLVHELGIENRCRFVDAVPEAQLCEIIAEHDVILGIFGESEKAASVLANKVWQGLACGRLLVTRESSALEEIHAGVGEQLQTCLAGDPEDLANTLLDVIDRSLITKDYSSSSDTLNEYVDREFSSFLTYLSQSLTRNSFDNVRAHYVAGRHD